MDKNSDFEESEKQENLEESNIISKTYTINEISYNCNFTCLNYNNNTKLLATGDSKGRISIWDYRAKNR